MTHDFVVSMRRALPPDVRFSEGIIDDPQFRADVRLGYRAFIATFPDRNIVGMVTRQSSLAPQPVMELALLRAYPVRLGHGSAVIDAMTGAADETGTFLWLGLVPDHDFPDSVLDGFYRKRGFEGEGREVVPVRIPDAWRGHPDELLRDPMVRTPGR